jgi:iron(III) transport system permease protein
MIFYLNFDIGIYGTIWIMFIAYITRFMPVRPALQHDLDAADPQGARGVCGDERRVMGHDLPPHHPAAAEAGLVAGWIYVMIVSIRELSSSILLYSPGTEVVSIVIWELWENGQYVELSALGVLLILALFVLVLVAQWLGKKFGVKE